MEIHLPRITFDMPLAQAIIDLERFRYTKVTPDMNQKLFEQIKYLFHIMESVGSTRIEGNNTTIFEYIENTKDDDITINFDPGQKVKEISNVEEATKYIERNIKDIPISLSFIRMIHKMVVEDLDYHNDGALHPGEFRQFNVRISGAKHIPPQDIDVYPQMQQLVDFINHEDAPIYDLVKVAIVHHRFVWIHPFENGNGRVVRLLTYAMLLKNFFIGEDRIINPTAVFCSNRNEYYNNLSKADSCTEQGMIDWISYMLSGLKSETEKIDNLSHLDFLIPNVLLPTLTLALNAEKLNDKEFHILKTAILAPNQQIRNKDIYSLFPFLSESTKKRFIKKMVVDNLLIKSDDHFGYYPNFHSRKLLYSLLTILDKLGFLPSNSGFGSY